MGMYDTIWVPCPKCKVLYGAQTKSGECLMYDYELANAPADAMGDANRHAPFKCPECSSYFMVELPTRATRLLESNELPRREDQLSPQEKLQVWTYLKDHLHDVGAVLYVMHKYYISRDTAASIYLEMSFVNEHRPEY